MCEDWDGLFLDGDIYRVRLFSGQNAKTGPGGARRLKLGPEAYFFNV